MRFDRRPKREGWDHAILDAEGYEVVNVDGGDMGRGWAGKPALKHLSDGRWLVVLEGTSDTELRRLIEEAPPGGALWVPGMTWEQSPGVNVVKPLTCGIWPIYGASGGLAHSWVAYLIYERKPEGS